MALSSEAVYSCTTAETVTARFIVLQLYGLSGTVIGVIEKQIHEVFNFRITGAYSNNRRKSTIHTPIIHMADFPKRFESPITLPP